MLKNKQITIAPKGPSKYIYTYNYIYMGGKINVKIISDKKTTRLNTFMAAQLRTPLKPSNMTAV